LNDSRLNPCEKCFKKFQNEGCLTVFPLTQSDTGGYYPAHVYCSQCRTRGPGRVKVETAIAAWNKKNPPKKWCDYQFTDYGKRYCQRPLGHRGQHQLKVTTRTVVVR